MDLFLLAQAGAQPGPGIVEMLLPIVLIFGVFYFIMWRPQAKRQKEHESFLAALKSGDDVVTTGGVLGTIRGIEEGVVTLEVSKGTKIKVLKSQIRASRDTVVSSGTTTAAEKSDS